MDNTTSVWSKDFPSNDLTLNDEAQMAIEGVQRHETLLSLKKVDEGLHKEERAFKRIVNGINIRLEKARTPILQRRLLSSNYLSSTDFHKTEWRFLLEVFLVLLKLGQKVSKTKRANKFNQAR